MKTQILQQCYSFFKASCPAFGQAELVHTVWLIEQDVL